MASFFNDFATGFFQAGADRYAEQNKKQDALDKIKAESLASVDAKKQLMDYESKRKREDAQIAMSNIQKWMANGAINQTPDAVVNAPKAVEATSVPVPNGVAGVDDNAQPFPASTPIEPTTVPQQASAPQPMSSMPVADSSQAPSLMSNKVDNNSEMQAQLATASHLSENPADEAGALLKYQEVKSKATKDSPKYRADLARLESAAKVEGEMTAKNAPLEPVKAQAKAARDTGAPAPTETGYFNKSPELRDKMDLEDNKFMLDWQSGQSELGKKYINASMGQSALMAAAQLQPDINTGGIIWGSQALNDLRTKFDPDADAYKGIVSQLTIEQAKQLYPVSNTDMTFLQKLSPQLEGTEEGNLAKIQFALMKNQALIDQFSFFNEYKNKWGTLDAAAAGFEKYMKENPLLDSKASEGIDFVANENRTSINDYLNGKKPEPKAEVTKATESKDAIPSVSDDASYNAIPKGQQYKDPQGNIRTKK